MKRIILGLLFATLVANAHAFYNPATGRWPSRDPMGEKGGFNLYAYVGNDSVNLYDRDGREVAFTYNPDGTMTAPVQIFRPMGISYFGCDDVLSVSDRSIIKKGIDGAFVRLGEVANGAQSLPSGLSQKMASCIKNKLDSFTISCYTLCDPICWVAEGIALPLSREVGICAGKIKKGSRNNEVALSGIILTTLHEVVHTCTLFGGHDEYDSPDKWAGWLTSILAK